MRKSLFLLLSSCLFFFNACKDDYSTFPEEPFKIDIESISCFNGGISLWVNLPNPQQYEYQWEVNGQVDSHISQTQGCQCITDANIKITRISDGYSIYKEFQNIDGCLLTE